MFPIAFSFVFPKIYILAMLLAVLLLFRRVCFEFRLKSKKGINNWDKLFFLSSLLATFIQGVIVGQIILGFPQHSTIYEIIFYFLTGVTLVVGYTLLGSCRLILKTKHQLYNKAQSLSKFLTFALAILMILIGIYSLYHHDLPINNIYKMTILSILGIIIIISFISLLFNIKKHNDSLPYWNCVSIFVFTYASMLVLIFPYIVPFKITYIDAAASQTTLIFTLIPALIMIPLLLLYTGYAYFVFRGKITEKIEY